MSKITIKTLRRAETELEDEIHYSNHLLGKAELPNHEAALEYGINAVEEFAVKMADLVKARFAIREAVRKFNEEKGINAKTLQIAQLQEHIKVLERMQSYGSVQQTSSYHTNTVQYRSGIPQTKVDEFRSQARSLTRQIQKLKDSCNGINSSSDASEYLDKDTIEFLRSNNFID